MRFTTFRLIEATTLIAVYIGCYQVNQVAALVLVSAYVCIRYVERDINRNLVSPKRLAKTGATSATAAILLFGLTTVISVFSYARASGMYPDTENLAFSISVYLFIFVLVFGGGAAICGACLGFIAGHWISFRSQFLP